MNDRYGYDPYGQQPPEQPGQPGEPRFLGYDEYGQPVYGYEPHDPYGQAPGRQQPEQQGHPYGDSYGQQPQQYQQQAHQHQQPQQQTQQQEWIPQQSAVPQRERYGQPGPGPGLEPEPPAGPGSAAGGTAAAGGGGRDREYGTEQFAFVEEPTDDSEDVIDWLKFSESRTERREEARRRGRNRVVALVVAVVLVAVGGVGYLWYAGKLPGIGGKSEGGATAAGQQRDVIVVHLRALKGGGSSTALLVDNADAKRGNTVLMPNTLAVSTEDGATTTLGKSVEDQGTAPTRDALGTLLGADIKGSWRLDTPYLENLVELVGGITLDANATVPGEKKGDKPLVTRGRAQDLDGRAAVAYATHRGIGEPQTRQLERFGEVMQQTLRKLSSDSKTATRTVRSLGQIPDPSLPEPELGASLAKLAGQAKGGSYKTALLPVRTNGTLSPRTSEGLVKQVLGGTVKNSDPDATPKVKVTNASGDRGADDGASAALVNGGYTVVNGGAGSVAQARSLVTYAEPKQRPKAVEVAKTLDLPAAVVRKGKGTANADVTVVLGRDYKG
ncbi:MAG: LCP family protein [Streptomyces sp.]|uniref:LCP family protein n=1 Tax=Streptomyces sp. TaxID=1931 RepID=UPI003D6A4E00